MRTFLKPKHFFSFHIEIRSLLSKTKIRKIIKEEKIRIDGEVPNYRIACKVENKEKYENLLKEGNVEMLKQDIINQVTPLAYLSYKEQLDFKLSVLKQNFARMEYPNFDEILPSPELEGYRNNNEYTFGMNRENEEVLGFRQGLFIERILTVERPTKCVHICEKEKELLLKIESVVKGSGLPIYNLVKKEGYWRQVKIRRNTENDFLIVFQINEEMSPETEKYLIESLPNRNIITQFFNGVSNAAPPDSPTKLLSGKSYIIEKILGLEFKISANSFFQVNSKACEVLYSKIAEWSKDSDVLLDLCCGTGTIGIILSKHFKKVIGIEMALNSVIDAMENAKRNNVKNTEHIFGKLEDKLKGILIQNQNQKVFAVIDPPRAGLHPKVCKAILSSSIPEFIYVSCNPTTFQMDYEKLKEKYKIEKAIGVDLFPHTTHCEIITHFVKRE